MQALTDLHLTQSFKPKNKKVITTALTSWRVTYSDMATLRKGKREIHLEARENP